MQNTLQLKNVILRKEYFGGLVASLDEKNYYQLNEDGFTILKLLKNPLSLKSLEKKLEEDYNIDAIDLQMFCNHMESIGIITQQTGNYFSSVYFEQKTHSPTDHLNAPTSISIYITQFCPKECKHCITRSSPYIDRSNELTPEQWMKVIDKLRDYGCLALIFTGGDCLSKKGIFDIIQYAESKHFMVGILTDYDGINTEHLQKISKLKNLIDVQISLDGGTEETHDWMRGKGSFEKCLKRMLKLNEYGISFTMASAIYDKNFNEVEKIADIAQEYGASALYLNPLCPYGRGVNMKENLLTEEQLYILAQKYLTLIKNGKISSGNPFWDENLNKIGDANFSPFSNVYDHVSTGFFNMAINWKGECYLDSKFSSEKKLCLGNIFNDEVDVIWNNEKLIDIRKKFTETGEVFMNKFDLLGSA